MSDPRGAAPRRGVRLDVALVERGIAETRSKAQGLVLAGRVAVDGAVRTRCGVLVSPCQEVVLLPAPRPFVSRGGGKLAGALDDLGIDPAGATALDVGASTGGFTDCLLRRGARRVYAVDVGRGIIDAALRRDPRVAVLEGVNFRYAPRDLLPEKVGLAVVDVSFISLRHILPPLKGFLLSGADVVALVKPQFEAGRGAVGKGGVVRDEGARREAVRSVALSAVREGFEVRGEAECRIPGPKGNREVFFRFRWPGEPVPEKP